MSQLNVCMRNEISEKKERDEDCKRPVGMQSKDAKRCFALRPLEQVCDTVGY
jgi:hypothetical protein